MKEDSILLPYCVFDRRLTGNEIAQLKEWFQEHYGGFRVYPSEEGFRIGRADAKSPTFTKVKP